MGVLGGAKNRGSSGSEPAMPSAADQAFEASAKRLALNCRRICSALMPPLLPVAAKMLRTSSCVRQNGGIIVASGARRKHAGREHSTQANIYLSQLCIPGACCTEKAPEAVNALNNIYAFFDTALSPDSHILAHFYMFV